jgi:uncharacterized protein YdiU (UPF0061 family)
MNSDNSAIGGYTLDYGPFGFMERFDPRYNSWVGGGIEYCWAAQPNAAARNLATLGDIFGEIVQRSAKKEALDQAEADAAIQILRRGLKEHFVSRFEELHHEACRGKLGLLKWDAQAQTLWDELLRLMSKAPVDYTLLFRALSEDGGSTDSTTGRSTPSEHAEGSHAEGSHAEGSHAESSHAEGSHAESSHAESSLASTLAPISSAALDGIEEWDEAHRAQWAEWLKRYRARLAVEGRPVEERQAEMQSVNPKYILRNWMAAEAYEAAARGDSSVAEQIYTVLQKPYEAQGELVDERWGGLTPVWARDRRGLATMS